MKVWAAALIGAVALAGCGGDGATGASGADVVPADATAYVEVDARLDSAQWERVQSLLDRFPARPQLVEQLNRALGEEGLEYERDVEPALGDTVVLVWPATGDEEDVVLLTQPDDEGKWRALVETAAEEEDAEYVLGETDGWHAVAGSQSALDAIVDADGSLADDDAFTEAIDELPEERLATVWARGDALADLVPRGVTGAAVPRDAELDWVAAAVEARDDGPAATIVARGPSAAGAADYTSELVDEAPSDALVFASFQPESYRQQLDELPAQARALVAELEGEAAVWVRPGAGTVEVTAVLGARDAERARAALDRLLSQARPFLPLELRSGVDDGRLVVTTAASVDAALRDPAETLGDSQDLEDARDAAEMPDENAGFVFVNVADALPLLSLAGLAGFDLPEELLENARPVRSIVAWSEASDDGGRFTLFAHIE